jgi:hypothetical protein
MHSFPLGQEHSRVSQSPAPWLWQADGFTVGYVFLELVGISQEET